MVDIQSSAPKRADVDASGHAVKTYPAKKHYLIEVGVAWENGHYRLTGLEVGGEQVKRALVVIAVLAVVAVDRWPRCGGR